MAADFSRRHYQRIASELRFIRAKYDGSTGQAPLWGEVRAVDEVAQRMAQMFAQDNPHFDAVRWLAAIVGTADDPAPYPPPTT